MCKEKMRVATKNLYVSSLMCFFVYYRRQIVCCRCWVFEINGLKYWLANSCNRNWNKTFMRMCGIQLANQESTSIVLWYLPAWPFPRYVHPTGSRSGGWTLHHPWTVVEIKVEMMKKESLLGYLHAQMMVDNLSWQEESLWQDQHIMNFSRWGLIKTISRAC